MKEEISDFLGSYYGYFVVAVSFIIMMGIWSAYYAFGIFFKPLLNEFGWTRAMTSGAFALATIISGLLAIAMGGLTDRFGLRIVMTICGLLLAIGYFFISSINAIWQFYLFFGIIVGMGMSGSFVPIMATIPKWFVSKRNVMIGIVSSGSGIGGFIGPPLAAWIISLYGWRISYMFLSSTILLLVVLSAQLIKRHQGHLDLHKDNIVKLVPFNTKDNSFTLREAIATKQFWLVLVNTFCFGICAFSIMVHISPHAIELHVSVADSAKILALISGFGIGGKIILGRLGDIIGNRKTLILAFTLMSCMLISLVMAKTLGNLIVFACIFGFAFGGISVSHAPLIAELFGLNSLGMVLGVLNLGFSIGGALGPLLTGLVFDLFSNYQVAFVVCAMVSVVGLLCVIFLGSEKTFPVNPSQNSVHL